MIAGIFAGIHAVAYQALLANALARSAAPDGHMINDQAANDHATSWRVLGPIWACFQGEKSKKCRNFKGFEHARPRRVFKKKILKNSVESDS